jgi:hypothetical protein
MEYCDNGILYITESAVAYWARGRSLMSQEIRELNRLICNRCEEREYEKCKGCRIYHLVNKIAER